MTRKMTRARAVAWMVGAGVLWSTAGLVARQLDHVRSWEATFWRSFFAALSMAGILAYTRRREAWAVVRASGWPGIVSGAMSWKWLATEVMMRRGITNWPPGMPCSPTSRPAPSLVDVRTSESCDAVGRPSFIVAT